MRLLFIFFITAFTSYAEGNRPNVVFILADDLGWAELGCYGNDFNETPNIDKLAGQGMRFTQAYAAAPVCSPYRAALLTGQHPARIGILDYLRPTSSNALPTSHVTLPEVFKQHGYVTGMVGKWHLTGKKYHGAEFEIKPRDHGFDWDFGREVKGVGNGANTWPYVFRNQDIRWLDIPENRLGEGEYLTDRLNLEAVDFVERNKDKPFFLYLSHYAPHSILNGRPDLVEKYRKKHAPGKSTRERCYICEDAGLAGDEGHHWAGDHNPHLAAMLESIDHGVGLLSRKLEELGLTENTIFIFSSDNGGETNVTSNAPLSGGKSQLSEGGIRVPMIVRWPGQIPVGTICKQPTANYDFYPTLVDAAGLKADSAHTLDGISTLASWKNPSIKSDRKTLYWHYPLDQPHFLGGVSSGAIRDGEWKLVEYFDENHNPPYELFRLTEDPSEKQNLADIHPERVNELKAKLSAWRQKVGASIPSAPLLVSPRQLYFGDHFSEGLVSERWHFPKEWIVEGGALHRNDHPGENNRIFFKDPEIKDSMIRFDFRFDGASDIRLVMGANGHYNSVVHIRQDHFFIQTTKDESGPYFSYRHDECAYDFKPGQWYTMTVEYIGDQLVAHLDHDHIAYARHPILDQERTYFAFQVDRPSASFDNLQVFQVSKHTDQAENLARIELLRGKYPVEKTLQEQYDIQKTNAHEWFYQREPAYRDLVKRVDEQKEKEKRLYPEIFGSIKDVREKIQLERRKLHAEDPVYKETLFSTYRAERAMDAYLISKEPAVDQMSKSKRAAKLESLRRRFSKDPAYLDLEKIRDEAQKKLENDYPQFFISNETINREKNDRRKAAKDDPAFKQLIKETSEAWRAQQDYIHENDKKLAELLSKLDKQKK